MSMPLHLPEPGRNRQLLIPALTSSVNDWAPLDGSKADVWLISGSGLSITGIDAQAAPIGGYLTLINIGAGVITLPHNSSSSMTPNRIVCPGGFAHDLQVGAAVVLRYCDITALGTPSLPGWVPVHMWGAAGGDLSGYYPNPTIANSAVTYAKMQNVTDVRLLGNTSGGAAAPSEISVGTGLTLASSSLSLTNSCQSLMAGGRLSLTSGVPVTTAVVSGATIIYYVPWKGDKIWLWDGSATWTQYSIGSPSIGATTSRSGTTHNGTAVIDGLSTTIDLAIGQKVTGTNVGVGAVINSIDSDTQVTVSANSTGSATNTLTFKIVSGVVYDIFAVNVGGTVTLTLNRWTSATVRANAVSFQNGVLVNTAAIVSGSYTRIAAGQGRLLGSILGKYIVATDGQVDDRTIERGLSNAENQVLRRMKYVDVTNSWTYTTASFQGMNASADASQTAFVCSYEYYPVQAVVLACASNTTANISVAAGVGIDSVTVNSADLGGFCTGAASARSPVLAFYRDWPGIGRHTVNALEISAATGATTWYGDNGLTYQQSGLYVELWS